MIKTKANWQRKFPKEMYEKFDAMLKEIDEEYRTALINFEKYKLVMYTMAKIMEMKQTERNKIVLYLINNANLHNLTSG